MKLKQSIHVIPIRHVPALGKQGGFSIVQAALVMALAGAVTIAALSQGGSLFGQARAESATTEIAKVMAAAGNFREAYRTYKDITIAKLVSDGFDVSPITTGTGDNTYGLNTSIVGASGNTDATLKYALDSQNACNNMIVRFRGFDQVKGTPTCASGEITVTLE